MQVGYEKIAILDQYLALSRRLGNDTRKLVTVERLELPRRRSYIIIIMNNLERLLT